VKAPPPFTLFKDEPIEPVDFDEATATAPEFSDEALALRFGNEHKETMRYMALWSKWARWDTVKWCFDDTLLAYGLARKICRNAAAECNKKSTRTSLASAKTVAAVEKLAKADRRLAATEDQWDADQDLLNIKQEDETWPST
jgi:putative DNA primase/helicase